jgi:hypothetical protein
MDEKQQAFTRRDFVRGAMGAAVGASVFGCGGSVWAADRPARSSTVVVVRDQKALDADHKVDVETVKRMLSEALTRATGQKTAKDAWLALVKPEDVVGLVATGHLNPTHPEVVQIVRASLVEAGIPEKNLRDAQGGLDKVKPCTALIALPSLKAHWFTGIGTVLKTYILYSGKAHDYHAENSVKLGEVWNLPDVKGKTKLILVDALRPLCDKGPQVDPRYLWDYRGLMAGTDPVAVETIAVRIITEKRNALRGEPWPLSPPPLCVAAADEKYGLGTSRMEEIKLVPVGWEEERLL